MRESAPITEAELQAYADGRLAHERRAEIEVWLAARPEEAERIGAYRRLSEEVRSAYETMVSEPVPERLTRLAWRRARVRRIAAVAGWMALGAVLGALGSWQLQGARNGGAALTQDSTAMARRAAIAHATYSPE